MNDNHMKNCMCNRMELLVEGNSSKSFISNSREICSNFNGRGTQRLSCCTMRDFDSWGKF